jgi:hypothetical protein
MSFDLTIIPQDAESIANFIEAVRTLSGTSRLAASAVRKYFGPAFIRNWQNIYGKCQELKSKVPAERHSEGNPALLVPLIDAASQESDDELQQLWAALLANATIDGGNAVRREYIDAVAQFEAVDALALRAIAHLPNQKGWLDGDMGRANSDYLIEQRQLLKIDDDTWAVACRALERIGCIIPAIAQGTVGASASMHPMITPFGRKLLSACTVS